MSDILSVFVRNVMLVGYWINTGLRKSPKAFCFNNCLSHWSLVTHIRVCELGHQWFRKWCQSPPNRYLKRWWPLANLFKVCMILRRHCPFSRTCYKLVWPRISNLQFRTKLAWYHCHFCFCHGLELCCYHIYDIYASFGPPFLCFSRAHTPSPSNGSWCIGIKG